MNREETLQVMSVLKAAYPSSYRDIKIADANAMVNLWTKMFETETYDEVMAAVEAFITTDTKGYPPHIGAIKSSLYKLYHADEMTEEEAWARVMKALRNSGYHSRDEYEKLPPILQRLVGSPNRLKEWALMDSGELATVVASNFQRSYRVRVASEREMKLIPADVQLVLGKCADKMRIPESADEYETHMSEEIVEGMT